MTRAYDVITDQVVETFESDKSVTLRMPDGNLLTAAKCRLEFRFNADETEVQAVILSVVISGTDTAKAMSGGVVAGGTKLREMDADTPVALLFEGADEIVELANVLTKQDWPLDLIASHRTEDMFSTYFDLANFEHI